MNKLADWIIHRARVVRLAWPDGVADVSGVAPAMLNSIADSGDLHRVGRGRRSFLARALKVSVRDLESLAAGRIAWIDDQRLVDLDRRSPNAIRAAEVAVRPIPINCPPRVGIPIHGRILETGKVELYENWTSDDGPRLPMRYAGLPDAFALRLETNVRSYHAGGCLVFQTISPGEVLDGEIALVTRSDGDADSEIGIIHRHPLAPMKVEWTQCSTGEVIIIELAEILRAARVLGSVYEG